MLKGMLQRMPIEFASTSHSRYGASTQAD